MAGKGRIVLNHSADSWARIVTMTMFAMERFPSPRQAEYAATFLRLPPDRLDLVAVKPEATR